MMTMFGLIVSIAGSCSIARAVLWVVAALEGEEWR